MLLKTSESDRRRRGTPTPRPLPTPTPSRSPSEVGAMSEMSMSSEGSWTKSFCPMKRDEIRFFHDSAVEYEPASKELMTLRLDRKSYGGARMQRTERAGCDNPQRKMV